MARPFRSTSARRGRAALKAVTFGAAAMAAFAVVSSGGSAMAAVTNPTQWSVNVTGAGLNLNLFGNPVVGGNATACANSGGETSNLDGNGSQSHCDGKAAPEAYAQGEGTLVNPAVAHGIATAEASSPNVSAADPSNAPNAYNCSSLSGGEQLVNGVSFEGAASCAYALAAIDANSVPSASAYGEVGHLNVDLAGVLGQVVGASPVSGASDTCDQSGNDNQTVGQLLEVACQVLTGISSNGGSSAPTPGPLFDGVAQALQNLYDVTTNDSPAQTASLTLGPAKAAVVPGASGAVTATASGESVKIDVLPGVGCTAGTPLVTCATNEITYLRNESANPTAAPLVTVNIGPASCTMAYDPTSGSWTPSEYASIVDLDINIPGDNLSAHVPGTAGSGQTLAPGTPLQSTVRVASASGSAAAPGSTSRCNADSLTVSLFESKTVPGGSTTPGGGALAVTLGSTNAGAIFDTPSTQKPGGPPPTTSLPPVPTFGSAASPTAVHTGEWWAGSLPLLAVIAALGGGLLWWPRLRRLPVVARLLSKGSR